ncbi:MAG: hypothetical protein LBK45_00505 [Tannerellaceae bacterium]|jgi:hypothetical protein|nr:hypothetical protein [Tannerellaceae bacterium]
MKTLLFTLWITLVISSPLIAQTATEYKPVGGVLQLKNIHLWRGQEVTAEATLATDIYYTNKKQNLRLGLWGGAGVNGNFKEIDYYINYNVAGFTFALWDIYNFSTGATYNNRQAFNYKARETGHFVDLSVAYQFPQKLPLRVYWATVLFGRDRGALNEKNRYSTFVELGYPVLSNKIVDLNVGIGGAFAMSKGKDISGGKSDAHFYGDSPGIVSINLTLSKTFDIRGYKLPLSITPMWNPEKNYANIQVALQLLSL